MKNFLRTEELFDFSHTLASELLSDTVYPHEALPGLRDFIIEKSRELPDEYIEIYDGVFAARDAVISDRAMLIGPTIICSGAEVRVGAYIRGSVIVGQRAVVGNSSEVKNSIIFDEGKLPHYNYLGDSILGYGSHMGAGAIASNLRLDKRSILIGNGYESINTGMKKLGAMLGDHTEVGCGAVLSPGTVLGKDCIVYPLTHVKGIIPERSIVGKNR